MFRDKIAIVTGGASGIGREMCIYLAAKGALVIVADINATLAAVVRDELAAGGVQCIAKTVDVAREDDVKALVQETHKEFGRIDLMINNAGIGLDGEFKDMTLEQWRHMLDVNLWGVVYATHYVYPMMIKQGFGQIVNVSSVAGLMPGGLMTSYTASKYAVVGLTLGLRAEAVQYGVKVNALCPGFIETPLHDATPKVSDYLHWEKNQRDKSRFPTANECILEMMRGIEKNKAIIVAPRKQKIFWWINRLFPALIPYGWRLMIKRMKRP